MAHHGCAVPPPPPPPLRPPPPLPPPPPAFRKLGANLSTRKSTRSKNSMFRALGTCFCISSQRRFDWASLRPGTRLPQVMSHSLSTPQWSSARSSLRSSPWPQSPRSTMDGATVEYHFLRHWNSSRVSTRSAMTPQSMSSSVCRPSPRPRPVRGGAAPSAPAAAAAASSCTRVSMYSLTAVLSSSTSASRQRPLTTLSRPMIFQRSAHTSPMRPISSPMAVHLVPRRSTSARSTVSSSGLKRPL
mmetsp:Transcript_39537/g.117591  ORF Transcript_39537/g.117591 Transcript_39537/m.117591 type:complete len:244 (+) Transcript_39537:73-804(+)